jgi:hypothetical protein
MQNPSSEQPDEDKELEGLSGVPISWFGYDPLEAEWVFVFKDGRRLILSSGEEAYYMISGRLH